MPPRASCAPRRCSLEARSASRLQVNGNVTTTTLNRGVEFDGPTVTPQNQLAATLDVRYAALRAGALGAHGAGRRRAATSPRSSADDVRRQTALATADAYLTIIARRRVVEAQHRARATARRRISISRSELQERGTGSRLNELRAQQELSVDEGLVEAAQLAVYRAQEALGVLLVADGPVDATDEPVFPAPPDALAAAGPLAAAGTTSLSVAGRSRAAAARRAPTCKLFAAEQQAAERVLSDSSKDRLPFLEAVFQPSTTYPSQLFLPQNSWRLLLQMTVPIFDSGQRAGTEARTPGGGRRVARRPSRAR